MNKIIVFANQKGGVGKTTLCTLFANFLASKGIPVAVIDCDTQQTIFEKRKVDRRKYVNESFLYDVKVFNISNDKNVERLIQSLKSVEGVILIDSPGNLTQQGLIPLFSNADFIICPYQYEATSVNSTVTFIVFIKRLMSLIEKMKSTILFVPNRYDSRIGTKSELELWKQTEDAFSKNGMIAPAVRYKADLQRYNTVEIHDNAFKIVQPTFNFMFEKIFTENEQK